MGRELVSALLTEARMRGANTAVLEVAECNQPAQSLYRMVWVCSGR
ncbi:MAG TPA: GNAT family N-acetyltransferase [Alphaproteobacteria bacterium]|nr:GNAT family N-acetyltransferase [Alphaproteobacteria bacterium]